MRNTVGIVSCTDWLRKPETNTSWDLLGTQNCICGKGRHMERCKIFWTIKGHYFLCLLLVLSRNQTKALFLILEENLIWQAFMKRDKIYTKQKWKNFFIVAKYNMHFQYRNVITFYPSVKNIVCRDLLAWKDIIFCFTFNKWLWENSDVLFNHWQLIKFRKALSLSEYII